MGTPAINHASPPGSSTRRTLLALAGAALLAACGGGGDGAPAPSTPTIIAFNADRAAYFVGDSARLTVQYSGGAGRIEPGIGPVASGSTVSTPPLAPGASYRLVVDGAGGSTSRTLAPAVSFRDRYVGAAAPWQVAQHAASVAADGSVLIIGGTRGENTLSDSIDRFDPATRSVTRIGSMRTGRAQHTATRLPDGRVLVAGGASSLQIGNVADLIDERSGAVSDGGALRGVRSRHSATLLADGRVLVVGGSSVVSGNSGEIWDPATNTWRLLTSRMAHGREYHSATLLADGRVLIVGGYSEAASYRFAELWDPRTEAFTPVAGGPDERRYLHTAHRLADGSVLIAGGEVLDPAQGILPLATAWRFDPARGSIEAAPALAAPRTLGQSLRTADDRVLLFGGQQAPGAGAPFSDGAERFALPGGGQPLAAMPAARAWHTVSPLPDGRVLIVGGETASGVFAPTLLIYE